MKYSKEEIYAALAEHFDPITGKDRILKLDKKTNTLKVPTSSTSNKLKTPIYELFYKNNLIEEYVIKIYEEYLLEKNYAWNSNIVQFYYYYYFYSNGTLMDETDPDDFPFS